MIQDDEELRIVQKQLAHAENALASLRRRVLPLNPRNYAVFSESYIDMIAQLRAEIDEYLGLPCRWPPADITRSDGAATASAPPPAPQAVQD